MNQNVLSTGHIGVHRRLIRFWVYADMDVTYRCNERCVHCYLDHDDHGEMTLAEIRDMLDQKYWPPINADKRG